MDLREKEGEKALPPKKNLSLTSSMSSSASSTEEQQRMAQDSVEAERILGEDEELENLNHIENILDLDESDYPKFALAKNRARFLRMVSWYKNKEEWSEVASFSGVKSLFKQQSKVLDSIRCHKMDCEIELEMGALTPSQRSYRFDELKMCKVHEKMAVHLISKLQIKIKAKRGTSTLGF